MGHVSAVTDGWAMAAVYLLVVITAAFRRELASHCRSASVTRITMVSFAVL